MPNTIKYHHGWLDTREDLINSLGRAKIVINFPRSFTEPELDVEMATMRYFQSMASKALVLGHCPPLLKEVFGYDPIISVDHSNPCEQVIDLLNHYSNYQELIEKNYQTLTSHHTFWHRWLAMKEILMDESDDRNAARSQH